MVRQQKLPGSGPAREALRVKGQFWTPDWLAEAMVGYVTSTNATSIFDPAVGAGAFFRAAKTLATQTNKTLTLFGTELDKNVLTEAREYGLEEQDLAKVQITDFVLQPPTGPFEAIVANPPYIRHHRLSSTDKELLKNFAKNFTGNKLDGRAGLHAYFLLRALQLLAPDGRLAFILPADICEGISAHVLWNWITSHYKLEAVVTFDPTASPFPKVDTNALVFLIQNAKPASNFFWLKCFPDQLKELKTWMENGCKEAANSGLNLISRNVQEGVETGLSRLPKEQDQEAGTTLAEFASVMRGIATGSNEFFFLTAQQANELAIPNEFLSTAVGRTRDVPGDEITFDTIANLQKKGRPTRLLNLDNRPIEKFPLAVQNYLRYGEQANVDQGELVKQRKPWYKMESRKIPPIVFAYLGRRNVRFIRNTAGILPLTGFLCVYPHFNDPISLEKLLTALAHPKTIANLALVGKSYGDGAIKVEPRALERLCIPNSVITEVGLDSFCSSQEHLDQKQSDNHNKQLNFLLLPTNAFALPTSQV